MLEIAKVYVNEVYARTVYSKDIPRGIVGARVAVEYGCCGWTDLIKNMVFTNGSATVMVMDAGDTVTIPAEVLDTAGLEIRVGVCGVSGDGATVIPTLWAVLGEVKEAVPLEPDEASGNLTPPVWAQLQAQIGALDNLETEDKSSLVAAINEAAKTSGAKISAMGVGDAIIISTSLPVSTEGDAIIIGGTKCYTND